MDRRNRIPLTDDIKNTLIAHQARTQIGPQALLRGKRKIIPDGLSSGMIGGWIAGRTGTARQDHLDFVLEEWAKLPDVRPRRYKRPITPQELEQLQTYRALGYLPSAALKAAKRLPAGVTASLISSWSGGHTRQANPDHLDFVLRACRTLDSSPQRPVILKGTILDTLKAEHVRTQIGPQALLNSERGEMAKEVSADLIYRWLRGYTKTARKDLIDYVLGLYAALPEYRKPSGRSTRALPLGSVRLTRAAILALKHHQKRTGLSAAAFLKQAEDVPEGITSADIVGWMRGQPKAVPEDRLHYVLKAWESLPDKIGR